MSETTDVQQANVLNESAANDSLRPFIQQLSLKIMQLGQLVLDLYAQGQLTHTAIVPLCDELLALEKTWLPASGTLDKPAEAATVVPNSDMPPQLPSAAVALTPVNLLVPTHCPQCHAELAPGKKFCTTCGLPVASMSTPDTTIATDETRVTLNNLPEPPVNNNLCSTCGTALQPNAAFCTHCGQPLDGQVTTPTSVPTAATLPGIQTMTDVMLPPFGPVTQFCLNCGKGLSADIIVCPDCGGTEFEPK